MKLVTRGVSESKAGISPIATAVELIAAVVTGKFIDPAKLITLFNASTQGAEGNIKQPVNISGAFSENITKYGTSGSIAAGASATITYAEAFSTATRNVQTTIKGAPTVGDAIAFPGYITSITSSGFTLNINDGDSTVVFDWFATGD